MNKKLVVLLVLAVLLCGCGAADGDTGTRELATCTRILSDAWFYRCIDLDAEVACWIYSSYGISCLPLSETGMVRIEERRLTDD